MPLEQSPVILDALQKRGNLLEHGINPYPYGCAVTHAIAEIVANPEQHIDQPVSIASRILHRRTAGKHMLFMDLAATISELKAGRKIQIMVKGNEVDKQTWTVIKNTGVGDWLGVFGTCFYTKQGELTVRVQQAAMLCKALRPLPIPKVYAADGGEEEAVKEAFAVQDQELLWRQPELDMLLREKAETLVKRSKVLQTVRQLLTAEHQCIEIETPYLNAFFGGAEATPFTTYFKAIDQTLYLPVSPEIELKRAVVGGIGSGGPLGKGAFCIARNFRNEGIDKTHNPEFTALEVYMPFVDYRHMMTVTEQLFRQACIAVHGQPCCSYQGIELDFSKPWPVHEMIPLLSKQMGVDVGGIQLAALREAIKERELDRAFDIARLTDEATLRGIVRTAGLQRFYAELDGMSAEQLRVLASRHKLHNVLDPDQEWDFLVLDLFDIYCEPFLQQPCHVIKHPEKSTPLCKTDRGAALPNGQKLIERFESFAAGMELSNAYSELNDPIRQRQLVEEQAEKRRLGDEEAMPHNELFLQAIEMGLPPCGGLGIGIDRLIMLLTDNPTIRNVIAFPNTRPFA